MFSFSTIEQKFGQAPRKFGFFSGMGHKLSAPAWIPQTGSYLIQIYNNQKDTFANGQLGLAAIVQANQKIFERGFENLPALVVTTTDKSLMEDPAALEEIGEKVYYHRDQPTSKDPEIAQMQELLNNEISVPYHEPLPKAITGGKAVELNTIMIHRIHLPGPMLEQKTLPVIVTDKPGGCIIIPAKYWK